MLMGVDAGDHDMMTASILDWIDPDDQTHIQGAESDFYENLTPAYSAKNGPIDDISELLMIKGITPEIFWGIASTNHPLAPSRQKPIVPEAQSAMFHPLSSRRAWSISLPLSPVDESTSTLRPPRSSSLFPEWIPWSLRPLSPPAAVRMMAPV